MGVFQIFKIVQMIPHQTAQHITNTSCEAIIPNENLRCYHMLKNSVIL